MKQENILIVDDQEMVREMMRDVLDAEGYRTIAVDSGRSALKMAQETDFDLLLSDIKMPEMSGLELVQELRQQIPDLVAILVTGYASIDTARRAIQEGVYDYIIKPFDRTELTRAVENALSRKRLTEENARLKWQFGLLQVTQAVATGSDYHQLLEFIVRTAIEETKSSGGSITLFAPTIHGVTIAAAVGRWHYIAPIANSVLNNGTTFFEAETGKCILLTDREQHPLFGLVQHHRLDSELWHLDVKDVEILVLAIESDKKTSGIMSICREGGPPPLSRGDLEMLTILAAEASIAVRNHQSLSRVEKGIIVSLQSIASLLDAKPAYLRGHMERVAHLSRRLGIQIGLSTGEVELVTLAANIHDLGKIGLDEATLNNTGEPAAGKHEWMVRHPVIADEILAPLPFLGEIRAIVRHHHERLDGLGYPDGLAGTQITPAMHVAILANAYDNWISGTPQRPAISPAEAIKKLREGKGSLFDPGMTDSFIAMLEAEESQP